MNFNFDELKAVNFSNRKASGPNNIPKIEFNGLRYRRVNAKNKKTNTIVQTGKFFIADSKFDGLDLTNNGLHQFIHPTTKQVFLAVVDHKDAVILKKTEKGEKGNSFKSDAVEEGLTALGIIDPKDEKNHQLVEMEEVGAGVKIDGVDVKKLFVLKAGDKKPIEKRALKPKATADAATGTVDTTAKAAPAPDAAQAGTSQAPVTGGAPAGKSEWD